MRSYTFSSSQAPEALPWRRVILLTALVTLLCFVALELTWRRRGVIPGIVDGPGYWSLVRNESERMTSRDVFLLGSSRFQLGLDPAEMAKHSAGARFFQLSVSGANPLPMLEDLAQDTSFHSRVLVEFMPSRYALAEEAPLAVSREYVRSHHHRTAVSDPEHQVRTFLQARLSSLHGDVSIKALPRALFSGSVLPSYSGRSTRPDRFVQSVAADVDSYRKRQRGRPHELRSPPLSEREFVARLEQYRAAATAIRARGGEVAFFRINSSGDFRSIEEELFPRESVYERAKAVIGGTWVHFTDDPELRLLVCPDGSHLMGDDPLVISRKVVQLFGYDKPGGR